MREKLENGPDQESENILYNWRRGWSDSWRRYWGKSWRRMRSTRGRIVSVGRLRKSGRRGGGLKTIARVNINMGEEEGAEKWGSREGTVRVGEGTLQQKTGINMEEEEETLA